MPHKTELIETSEENGHFIADFVCCGVFAFRASALPDVVISPDKLAAWEERNHKAAALAHEAEIQGKANFHSLKGKTVDHQ